MSEFHNVRVLLCGARGHWQEKAIRAISQPIARMSSSSSSSSVAVSTTMGQLGACFAAVQRKIARSTSGDRPQSFVAKRAQVLEAMNALGIRAKVDNLLGSLATSPDGVPPLTLSQQSALTHSFDEWLDFGFVDEETCDVLTGVVLNVTVLPEPEPAKKTSTTTKRHGAAAEVRTAKYPREMVIASGGTRCLSTRLRRGTRSRGLRGATRNQRGRRGRWRPSGFVVMRRLPSITSLPSSQVCMCGRARRVATPDVRP